MKNFKNFLNENIDNLEDKLKSIFQDYEYYTVGDLLHIVIDDDNTDRGIVIRDNGDDEYTIGTYRYDEHELNEDIHGWDELIISIEDFIDNFWDYYSF